MPAANITRFTWAHSTCKKTLQTQNNNSENRERSKIEKNVKSDEPVSSIHQEGKHVLFYKHTHTHTHTWNVRNICKIDGRARWLDSAFLSRCMFSGVFPCHSRRCLSYRFVFKIILNYTKYFIQLQPSII